MDDSNYFKCNKCGEVKELTSKNFHKSDNSRGFRAQCKVCRNKKESIWREENPYEMRARQDRFLSNNPEYYKDYYKENKERIKENYNDWVNGNPDRYRELSSVGSSKRRAMIESLPNTLSNEEWGAILTYFNNSCSYCGDKRDIGEDHVVPVFNGGGRTKENIIASCGSCNRSKGIENMDSWYLRQDFYSEDSMYKIKNRLT